MKIETAVKNELTESDTRVVIQVFIKDRWHDVEIKDTQTVFTYSNKGMIEAWRTMKKLQMQNTIAHYRTAVRWTRLEVLKWSRYSDRPVIASRSRSN